LIADEIKKPLNKIYQNYFTIIESAGLDEKMRLKYLALFKDEKDDIISNIELIKIFFGNNINKNINLYTTFEKISQFLEHDFSSRIKMEIYGKHSITVENQNVYVPQMVMLISTLMNGIAKLANIKNTIVKVMIQEEKEVINIALNNSELLCQELLKFESNQEIFTEDAKLVNDTYNIFTSLLSEVFHGDIKVSIDSCEISIPKRYMD
jgi:hypothetical protein